MFNRNLLIAAAFALTAGAGFAQAPATPTAAVIAHQDQRDINQENRIQAGKADGKVTPREARHVQKMQDKASKDIYKQKHDAQGTVSSTK